jgi:hypothetical protein
MKPFASKARTTIWLDNRRFKDEAMPLHQAMAETWDDARTHIAKQLNAEGEKTADNRSTENGVAVSHRTVEPRDILS